MTSEIFVEFLNKLNNKMKLQDRNILLFLDNCPSHPAISLSSIKLVFYPKNCTSKLQAMDLGVIANLKAKYKRRVYHQGRIMLKTVKDVQQFVSQLAIFDAILHCKNALDSVIPETIIKCFNNSGIYNFDASPPCSPESKQDPLQEKDPQFDEYFEKLLGIPWDEYLMMDEVLEAKNRSHAPDANTYNDHAQDLPDQDHDQLEPMPTVNDIIKSLKMAQCFVLGNDGLCGPTDQLIVGIQKMNIKLEVLQKSKKSTKTSFFKYKC